MSTTSFIYATGQRWTLVLPLSLMSLVGGAILLQPLIREYLGPVLTMKVVLLSTFVGLFALLFPCVALRCPRCKLKLLWRAVSTQPSGSWLLWLLSLQRCPECRHAPVAPGHAA